MAQIPDAGQLGYNVAQPTRTPLASPEAFGAGLGQTVEQVGQQMVSQEQHAAALAEQQRKAAERATAMSELQVAQDDLAAIHDEVAQGIRTGQIPKQDAASEWQRRAQERVAKAGEALPPDFQQIGNRELSARVNRFGRSIGGAVMERDQQDVRSGIDQTLEYASRLYAKGDRETADKMVAGTLADLGPFSGLAPDQIQKKQQAYREASRFTYATGLVAGARMDNAALDKVEKALNGDEFADLDPQRKQALLTSIDGYRISNMQRAEAEMRRRQAAQEHQLKVAEASYNAATLLINQGKVLSPEYVSQVTQATAGTPYGAAFRESIKSGPEKASFGAQPLATQQQALQQLRGQLNASGTDPKIEKRFGELETIYKQAVQDYAQDPLPAAQERGVIGTIEPINTSSITGLVATIGSRVGQAQIVQQQVGAAVSPLTQREAEDVSKLITVLPVEQRATAIAQLTDAVGAPVAQALARQIAGKDKALGLAFAAGAAKTTAGRYTSTLILKGAQAIQDKTIKADEMKLTGWRAEIAKEIGDAYTNDELRQAAIDSAYYARAGLEAEGTGSNSQAVRLATGGITERNGKKVPLPYGMEEGAFEDKLKKLTPANVLNGGAQAVVAGKPMPMTDFLRQVPDAQLVRAGNSRYAVMAGGGVATDVRGRPLVLEVK